MRYLIKEWQILLYNHFDFFYKKEIFNEIFCNLFLKELIVASIDHMFSAIAKNKLNVQFFLDFVFFFEKWS
jgi:hypothetical protein